MAPRIITAINQKGGPGKTNTAVHLAAALAGRKLNVLAVDADRQGTLSDWASGADNMAADGLGEAFPFTVTAISDEQDLRRLPSTKFDFIVIDTPGHFDNDAFLEAVGDVTDLGIIPIKYNRNALKPIARTVRSVLSPMGVPYRCVLNEVDGRRGRRVKQRNEAALDKAGLLRFEASIHKYQAYDDAADDQQLVSQLTRGKSRHEAVKDFDKLADELLTHWDAYTTTKEA